MSRLVQQIALLAIVGFGSLNGLAATLSSVPGFTPVLGQGYDSKSGNLRLVCFTGDVIYAGTNESLLEVGVTKTSDEIKADVEATLLAGIDAFVVAAEAEAKLTSFFASTSLENRYFTSAYVRGKRAILKNPRLTEVGKQVFESKDAATIGNLCGNTFVNEVGLGVSFVFSLSLKHADQESKNRVKTTYKIKLPFKALKKSKEKSWNIDANNTKISFDAVQFGGSHSAFNEYQKLLNSTSCERDGLHNCFAKAESALEYVTGANGLYAQLGGLAYDFNRGTDNPVLFAKTAEFSTLPGGVISQSENVFLPNFRRANGTENIARLNNSSGIVGPNGFAELVGKQQRLKIQAERFLAESRFPQERRSALADELSKLRFNAAIFESVRSACKGEGPECASEWERLQKQIFKINEVIIERPLRFADYCINNDVNSPWGPTLAAVLSKSATNDCLRAEAWLESQQRISMREMGITDLAPIAWAPNVNSIDLARNSISFLPAQLNWPGMLEVNFAHNKITDVSQLQSIRGLKSVNLAYNSITSFFWRVLLDYLNINNNLISNSVAKATSLVLNDKNSCQYEMELLVKNGVLTRDVANFYLNQEFGPELAWNGDTKTFTGQFGACEVLVDNYD